MTVVTDVSARMRSKGVTYRQLLDEDSRDVPAILRRESPLDDGPMSVPVERYTSPEFFQLERDKLWDRVWQMACREEAIPTVGDHIVYDIAGRSYIVVRSGPSTIQAFHNVCRHRGRLLREVGGVRSSEFRCPFHGWTFSGEGSCTKVPYAAKIPPGAFSRARNARPPDCRPASPAIGATGGPPA